VGTHRWGGAIGYHRWSARGVECEA
jgi:hypothetical protein